KTREPLPRSAMSESSESRDTRTSIRVDRHNASRRASESPAATLLVGSRGGRRGLLEALHSGLQDKHRLRSVRVPALVGILKKKTCVKEGDRAGPSIHVVRMGAPPIANCYEGPDVQPT